MIDLCVGPHIPNTGYIKAFSVLKVGSRYFEIRRALQNLIHINLNHPMIELCFLLPGRFSERLITEDLRNLFPRQESND